MTDSTDLDTMLTAISAAWGPSHTPPEKRAEFVAWAAENREHCLRLHALIGATAAWWIVKGAEAGHDRDILDQVALQETQRAIARIARVMKARQGEAFSPARVAIVAYQIAGLVAADDADLDIDAIANAADDIGADTGAENARLRRLIEEFTYLDTGELSPEHRDLITRCRAEQTLWTEDAAG